MNYELLAALGAVGAALVLAFLYARASAKAAQVDSTVKLNHLLASRLANARALIVAREVYTRELEKAHLAGLPASELAQHLNRLFAAGRSGAASPVLPGKPKAGNAGD